MTMIRHINLADAEGKVYCCLRNKLVNIDAEHKAAFCTGCKMFAGEAPGLGIVCQWDDMRAVADPHYVNDPHEEWASNQSRKINPLLAYSSENELPVSL